MLLAVGLAGGAAAVAVATVPDSNGVIHACYSVSNGEPAANATLTVIDPSAGQTCATTATPGAVPAQRELSWNQQGPPGAPGSPGSPGQQGPQGPPGNTAAITKGGILTLSGGQAFQVESAGGGVILPTPNRGLPGTSNVVIGSGAGAVSFDILSLSVLGSGAGGGTGAGRQTVRDISVTKTVDKSSAKLFQACASGQHFPKVTITLRKKGGQQYLRYTLSQVFISAVQTGGAGGQAKPTEQVSFSYGKVQVQYLAQK